MLIRINDQGGVFLFAKGLTTKVYNDRLIQKDRM